MSFSTVTPGPPRLPVAVKIARGTYKPGRDGPALRDIGKVVASNKPAVLLPRLAPAPGYLDDHARRVYRRVGKVLLEARIVTVLDTDTLAGYSHALSQWIKLESIILKSGHLIKDASGDLRTNPIARQSREYRNQADRLASHLGLTPVSRQRILASLPPEPVVEEDDSPIGQLLARRAREWWDIPAPSEAGS